MSGGAGGGAVARTLARMGYTPGDAAVGTGAVFLPLIILGIVAAAIPTSPWLCGVNQHPMAPSPGAGAVIAATVTLVAGIGLARVVLAPDTPRSLKTTAVAFFVATLAAVAAHVVQVFQHKDVVGGLRSLRAALALLLGTMMVFASIDAFAGALLLPAAGWLLGVYRLHTFVIDNNREALKVLRPAV
jgi:tryptophan-rich sensory protein